MRVFFSLNLLSLFLALAGSTAALAEALRLTTKLHRNIPPSALLPGINNPTLEPFGPPQQPPLVRPLPDQENGAPRYDALNFLLAQGISRHAGTVAIYLPNESALVFVGSPEDQDLVERVLEMPCCFGAIKSIELTISAWTYLDDPAALVKNQVKTFDEIKAIAGDSLRPLDSHLIVTRSGNRAISTHLLAGGDGAPEGAEPSTPPAPVKTPGSVLAIEPVIGPDGSTVDFQLEYQARIPQPGAPVLRIAISTNATIGDGANLILQNLLFPPIDGQEPAKVRRCAIIVSSRVLVNQPQFTAVEMKERDERIITEALKGLPEPKH